MTTPTMPERFTPDGAPVGVEVKFVEFLADRPPMTPTALHYHTNSAPHEGTVDSAWNWSHAAPNSNTLPHYQLDRTHNGVTRCRKMCPTDRKGIGSTTVGTKTVVNGKLVWPTLTDAERAEILAHPPNVSTRTIVIETADTGELDDPTISAFDPGQLELAATILAYESIVWDIPLTFQPNWWTPGAGSHTDPAGFPFTTIYRGKTCPGDKKKAQVRDVILPRAIEIHAAWTDTPPGDDDMYTDEDRTRDKAIYDALFVKDPGGGPEPLAAKINQIHTIMRVLWDGFPGSIMDGPGVAIRILKRLAVKAGVKTD